MERLCNADKDHPKSGGFTTRLFVVGVRVNEAKSKRMAAVEIDAILRDGQTAIGPGPVALIFAEDGVAIAETITHHLTLGFERVILFAPPDMPLPELPQGTVTVAFDPGPYAAVSEAVSKVTAAAPEGTWIYYAYNAEFLFFPFCDSRSVGEMLAFHAEERRNAMVTFVVDLYPADLAAAESGVSFADAQLDGAGYYALARKDPENDWQPKERQLDFFGGLRWRFEQHVPHEERRIDRVSLFRAASGLKLLPDHRLNDEEANTYACPWHNNLTAAICSYRASKALQLNPGSRAAVTDMRWAQSVPFDWSPEQLMQLGLMEPGQWF